VVLEPAIQSLIGCCRSAPERRIARFDRPRGDSPDDFSGRIMLQDPQYVSQGLAPSDISLAPPPIIMSSKTAEGQKVSSFGTDAPLAVFACASCERRTIQ
jgi:hypothetical protein